MCTTQPKYWLTFKTCLLVGNIDTDLLKEAGLATFYKALSTMYDWMLTDENVQVNGIVIISDFAGLTLETFRTLLETDVLKDFLTYLEVGSEHILKHVF